ncbi:MAG TPA: DUF308 domain-containing protein [Gammaproteobacteria bacterium]|nr:DUF308 domain-containing protein [Gammaproteobacteria bacterium]
MNSVRINPLIFGRNWGLFFAWGVGLAVLGILAISMTTLTTIFSVIFLGMLLFIAGTILLIDTFTFWWQHKGIGFLTHLLMSVLYMGIGFFLIKEPVSSSISFTLALGIFYLIIGSFRIFYSWNLRSPQWGWYFANALLSLLLGILILSSWPESGLYVIGLFIGIDLFFCGLAYMVAAIGSRTN